MVSFTGSTDVGRTVAQRAAPSFKKVHLEMGGKNVIIVMDDAVLELALEGCLWGGFGTSGQRCTAACTSPNPVIMMIGSRMPWRPSAR